jgi:hypothetical protein
MNYFVQQYIFDLSVTDNDRLLALYVWKLVKNDSLDSCPTFYNK